MSKFKIGLFFTNIEKDYNKAAASTWIRIMQMIEVYEALGIEVSINNFFKRHDAAIIYRKSKKKYYWMLRLAKLISKKVYFDTCINIFDLSPEINETRLKYAHKIAEHADGFICASRQIARLSAPFCKSTFPSEDPVDLNHFKHIKSTVNFDKPIFGWSGVSEKAYFLNKYADKISKRIVLITQEEILGQGLRFEYDFINWNYHSFPQDLLKCDIAFLPRVYKDNYNSGHSSFKALVFAVSGIPIIANRIPSYVDMARFYDGIVFLEDHNDDVDLCIKELRNKSLDTSSVRQHYSCQNQASLLFDYLASK